jgi:hypothetical protein
MDWEDVMWRLRRIGIGLLVWAMIRYAADFFGGANRYGESWGFPILAGFGLAFAAIYLVVAEVRRSS